MDKKSTLQSHLAADVAARLEAKDGKSPSKIERGGVWTRDDGAICVGNECIVIKRVEGSKDLDIDIAPTKCGETTASMLVDTLLKTIGKGGNTRFTIKSELEVEGDVKK